MEDKSIIVRVDESTKGIVQELSGAVSDRIHSDVSRIDSNLQGIRDSLTKLESIKSIIRKLDDISDVLESDSGDASKTVFLDALTSLRELITKESERYTGLLSSESEMVKSVQEQSARIAEKAETIESRVSEPIMRIESMLSAVKASTDELVAPTDDPDKKSAVVSDITSAKAAILDLISGTALSNKSSIEALPEAVSFLRGLLEKESEKTDVIGSRVGEPIARIESQLSSEFEMVKSVQERSLRIENSLATIKTQLNSILEKLAELKTTVDSIHDRTNEIVEFEQEILPKINRQLGRLSAQQEESKKIQLSILYRTIPFWKSKERKAIKALL
jgi:chromosome segregation ATPase